MQQCLLKETSLGRRRGARGRQNSKILGVHTWQMLYQVHVHVQWNLSIVVAYGP